LAGTLSPRKTRLPSKPKNAIGATMSKRASKKYFYVLQDRKRLPQRFFAALSGRATAHLG
jgi:hypothetical protein